jgi:preprotein translocase subunit YajC
MNDLITFLATTTSTTDGGSGNMITMIIVYVVVIGAMLYFMAIRPQKKQQESMNQVASAIAVGDSVLTTSGFYGVIVDIKDEIVVVEFGSNKNCRIPMKKVAIQTVEKPDGTTVSLS